MAKVKVRRPLMTKKRSKRQSSAYQPIELTGEVIAATNGIQVIDGDDFDKRAEAIRKVSNKEEVHA